MEKSDEHYVVFCDGIKIVGINTKERNFKGFLFDLWVH